MEAIVANKDSIECYCGFIVQSDALKPFKKTKPAVFRNEPRYNIRTGEREPDEKVLVSGGEDFFEVSDILKDDEFEFIEAIAVRVGCIAVADEYENRYVLCVQSGSVIPIAAIDKKKLNQVKTELRKLGILKHMEWDEPVFVSLVFP